MAENRAAEEHSPAAAVPVPGETPDRTDPIEPGMQCRRVTLPDGRYMLYYEFERRQRASDLPTGPLAQNASQISGQKNERGES